MNSWIVDQFLSHDWRFRRRKWNGEQQFKKIIEYDVHNYRTEAIWGIYQVGGDGGRNMKLQLTSREDRVSSLTNM